MAILTFVDLQNEVFDHTGLDNTDANNLIRVKRWINYTTQDLCARWPWPFMESSEQFATVSDYTTGTASVNNGSTTVTGSGTAWTTTQANGQYYIQFAGSNDWYNVTARASGTSITIDQAYQPTANASGVAYILRKFYYSLSSSCDRIISVVNWNTPLKLIEINMRTVNELNPNPQSTNTSYGYMPWGYDSSGNVVIIPYPFPTDNRLFQFKTLKRPTDMVGDSTVPSIPNKYAQVLAWGALVIAFGYLRKFDIAQGWNSKFEGRIAQMKGEYRLTEDYQPILRSIDSIQRARWISMPGSWP